MTEKKDIKELVEEAAEYIEREEGKTPLSELPDLGECDRDIEMTKKGEIVIRWWKEGEIVEEEYWKDEKKFLDWCYNQWLIDEI